MKLRSLSICIFFFLLSLPSLAQEPPPPRWLQIPSIPNGRDAGGYPTIDGNFTKYGILFRSNQPVWLNDIECDQLRKRGIKTVIDLRWEAQRLYEPDSTCLLRFANYVTAGIWCDADFSMGYTIEELYIIAINQYASSFRILFETVAKPENYPVLIHCLAGKDRTGMAVALIQLTAGVPENKVMEEYMLSNEAGYGVAESWLKTVFDAIHAEGGLENFLSNRKIPLEMQMAVRKNLLAKPVAVDGWGLY